MFLSKITFITKTIVSNIFENDIIIYLNIVSKQFKHYLNVNFIIIIIIIMKSNTKSNNNKIYNRHVIPSKILSSIIFVIGDFTQKS